MGSFMIKRDILEAKNKNRKDYKGMSAITIDTPYPISILYPIVEHNEELVVKLMESIKAEGMLDPIVVACITVQEWMDDDNPGIKPPPDRPPEDYLLRIQRGNNRVVAAIRLGYGYIDCLLFNNIESACIAGDKIMRKNKGWMK